MVEVDDKYLNLLIQKYRTEEFQKINLDIEYLDQLITNEDLAMIIEKNNNDMQRIINSSTDIEDNKEIKGLFYANLNFYRLARFRKLNIPGLSFMKAMATAINFPQDENILDQKKLTKKR